MEVPLIPLDVLFGDPVVTGVKISPSGRYLSYVAPLDGVKNIWVKDLKTGEVWPVTKSKREEILHYRWLYDDKTIVYLLDRDGDENFRIFRTSKEGDKPVLLTPPEGIQATILLAHPDYPDELVIQMNDRDRSFFDVYILNVKTGERKLVMKNEMGAREILVDEKKRPRIYTVPLEEGGYEVFSFRDGRWEKLMEVTLDDELATQLIMVRGNSLYMTSSVGRDKSAVVEIDLKTGDEKILAQDEEYDFLYIPGMFLYHPRASKPEAVAIIKERIEWIVLDRELNEDFKILKGVEPGDFGIQERDVNRRFWIIYYFGDDYPHHYYLYDREKKEAKLLFKTRPDLEKYTLAKTKPIKFKARDGLIIHGYLTLPPGKEPRNLPAVIYVHGGPWWRDLWGFDPIVQWLANRGYAVLQINFRGSTGYGKYFVNIANKEWGGKMQDDITDGVKWLIAQGIADPKRIAILGGSYGGYATLAGVTFTPDLYRAGVDIVGPSNLFTFLNSVPPYWKPYLNLLYKRVGHPEKDKELLRERSPLFHVDRIKAPLLIGQGRNDPRVKREESLQIVEALKKRGMDVEYVEYPDEGHGFVKAENRLDFYRRADKFLARHLGGRAE